MKKRIFISVFYFTVVLSFIYGQDFSTYEKRKQWMLESGKDIELVENGKHGISKALVRLYFNPKDRDALVYMTHVLDNRNQYMFDFPGVTLALCRYWDNFTPAQRNKIRASLESLAKEDKNNGEGFMGHGTENHATMMWAGAYLAGQLFPDAKFRNGMTGKELMAEMKERMRKTFKNVYKHGYAEYLSTTYEITMNFPVEILMECAEDPEVKAIAEAFMLYKWSLITLNNFDGTIIAPYGRTNTWQDRVAAGNYVAGTSYYNWLMWGWGNATDLIKQHDFRTVLSNYNATDMTFAYYTAVSKIVPDEIFFKLANSKEAFSMKTSASTFGHYANAVPHMMMRKVYRDKRYAIGTGNFRWIPGGDYSDFDITAFNIIWDSPDRFNYITCFHPYWFSDGDDVDQTPDTWYRGGNSPFQQTAHHKNTAIVLFDIPDKDPWPANRPTVERWGWRDGHTDNLIKRAQLSYPESMDEQIEEGGWIFLREGKAYVGIKPLKDYTITPIEAGKGFIKMEGFKIAKSNHAQTGFIFEVGSEEEHGSFKKFREKLQNNKISVDWNKMTINYTTSHKDKIQIQYVPGLPVKEIPLGERPDSWLKTDITGMAESIPVVTINGKKEIPYQQWPMIESPYVNMDNSILKIDDGTTKISVDWTGDLPEIVRNK